MTPPQGWRIDVIWRTYRRFSPSACIAHSASSRFWCLQPFGNYSLHIWVQVQCKAATAFPQSERKRVEARVGSCSRTSQCSSPWTVRSMGYRRSASRRRQRRLLAYWCLWKRCRVEWKAKERLAVTLTEAKTLRKFDIVRSLIGDRRSAVAENVDNLRDKFGGAQDTREEEIDQSEGFDGDWQR